MKSIPIPIVRPIFPFTAIIGQEDIKLSLLLNVIDQKIGGVIAIGDRGTGKSTTVRSLVDLLPDIEVVQGDPFQSHPTDPNLISLEVQQRKRRGDELITEYKKTPILDLPLGSTEDRVCGTIDIEKALRAGIKSFEPGILARANRGILYIDEVNLLEDHLVDVILDAAASGWNTVEREGISIRHPARFILVGSGNPEEGELRPQLLDRFGIHAKIETTHDSVLRVQIVERCSKFDLSPIDFCQEYDDEQKHIRDRICSSKARVDKVDLSYDFRIQIAQLCSTLKIDGLRGDIVRNRSVRAIAAFEGCLTPSIENIKRVATLCLSHRMRKDPLERLDSGDKVIDTLARIFIN
jgi:magnesium chelatase subunit I